MNAFLKYIVLLVVMGICIVVVVSYKKAGPVQTTEVIAVSARDVPVNPKDPAWNAVSEHTAKLIPQDLVEPRQMKSTTPDVHVRAITNGTDIAFRLEWEDTTRNEVQKPAAFSDACAIQVPTKIEANVPAPQMGEAGKPVEITIWKADWQAWTNGREDSIKSIYPNAQPDHYPFEAQSLPKGSPEQQEMAKRYAPASAAGNRRVGPRDNPVEDLLAEGPGTITPVARGARGLGVRTETGWQVVIVRKLPTGLSPQVRSQIAFAVWEGSHQEVGARKMRTGWVPLHMKVGP